MDIENDDLSNDQIEKEARNMGWVPKEEFKGNKDHWVEADEFVERGKTVMPILLQNNRRLQKELDKRDAAINNLNTKLSHSETVMVKLEKHYTEANKRAVETAKIQLREELKQAREDNDVDKEMEVLDQLEDMRKRTKEIEEESKPPAKKSESKKADDNPEFEEWVGENPWFDVDKKKTKLVVRIAEDLRDEGTKLQGKAFFDECLRLYEEQYGEQEEEEEDEPRKPVRKVSKVDTPTNRRSSSNGKTFADLPAAAKQACWEDVEDLVGPDPGKRYKTKKEWETAYAKIYWNEE